MGNGLQNFKTPMLRIDDITVSYIVWYRFLYVIRTCENFTYIYDYASQEMNDNSSSWILDTLIEIF